MFDPDNDAYFAELREQVSAHDFQVQVDAVVEQTLRISYPERRAVGWPASFGVPLSTLLRAETGGERE